MQNNLLLLPPHTQHTTRKGLYKTFSASLSKWAKLCLWVAFLLNWKRLHTTNKWSQGLYTTRSQSLGFSHISYVKQKHFVLLSPIIWGHLPSVAFTFQFLLNLLLITSAFPNFGKSKDLSNPDLKPVPSFISCENVSNTCF